MAYFPNGTSGDIFQDKQCQNCIHNDDCAVWDAHMLHNYDECNNNESILHILIPMDVDGIYPENCRMFIAESKGSITQGTAMSDSKQGI